MGRSKTRRGSTSQGFVFGPFNAGMEEARRLFTYVGAWVPPVSAGEVGWGAWAGKDPDHRLIGAALLELKGVTGMLYGPVVVEGPEPVETAAQLLATLLPRATGLGVQTLFARPQGLDRVWVRFGFIPVPEAELPTAFKGRPGAGLFAWRGGTALWSTRKLQPDEGALAPPRPVSPGPAPPHRALSPGGGEDT